jgi:thioredoxin:protein disulfide reductase
VTGDLLSHGFLFAFGTAFVGGFLTSLTPCVYPLIPVTVSIFGARGKETTRLRSMFLAAMYVAGMGAMYAGLGIFSALAGKGFGTQLANPWVVVPIAVLFLAMAASMFGAFELSLPSSLQERLTKVGGEGPAGAFGMGLVGGIIAAPCTGPVLASILAYVATTRSVGLGASLLFTYALGMGVLFFVIAAFAVSLPRSGAWMEAVKSIFGVSMIDAAFYFLLPAYPALGSMGSAATPRLYLAIALIVAGTALGAIHLSFHHSGLLERVRKGVGVVLVTGGVWLALLWAITPKETHLVWSRDEAAAVAGARQSGKPAFLDFYADWCLPCKELDIKTFSDPRVAAELARFTLVKVDNTQDDDPEVIARKKRYGADTLPTLVVIDSRGTIVDRISRFMKPDELLPILRRVQ